MARPRRTAATLLLLQLLRLPEQAVAQQQQQPPPGRANLWAADIDRRLSDLDVMFSCASVACAGCDRSCRECETAFEAAATAADPLVVSPAQPTADAAAGGRGSLWVNASALAPGESLIITLRSTQITAAGAVRLRFMDEAVGALLTASRVEPWAAGEAQISVANTHPSASSPAAFGLAFVVDAACDDCDACDTASCGSDGRGTCPSQLALLLEATPTAVYTLSLLSAPSAEPVAVATTVTSTCSGSSVTNATVSVIPQTMVFFLSSWDVPQKMSLLFADDWVHEAPDCEVEVTHTTASDDADYDGLQKVIIINATVQDKDDAPLYVLPDSLLLHEGEAVADCATGYTAGDANAPSTTCPTGCTQVGAAVATCSGTATDTTVTCSGLTADTTCSGETGCTLNAATSETCTDTVEGGAVGTYEVRLASPPGCARCDGYHLRRPGVSSSGAVPDCLSFVLGGGGVGGRVEEPECAEVPEAMWSFDAASAVFSNGAAPGRCLGYDQSSSNLTAAVCDDTTRQEFQQDSGDASLYCSAVDASVCFTAVASSVTITPQLQLGVHDGAVLVPTSLNFLSTNWRDPQHVSIHVADDNYADGQRSVVVEHIFAPRVGAPSSSNVTVSAVIVDDDVLHAQTSISAWDTMEGNSSTYTVQLTAQPRGDVAVHMHTASGMRDGLQRHRAALSCSHLLRDFPHLDSGVYWVDPLDAAEPFQVACDMVTEGGGWYVLSVRSDLLPEGLVVAERFAGNPWSKCSDDAARHYYSLISESDITPVAVGDDEHHLQTLVYSSAFDGDELTMTDSQIAAIRNQTTEMSTNSRIVVSIADDSGYAVFALDAAGSETNLSPGVPTSCGESNGGGGTTAFYFWHNTDGLSKSSNHSRLGGLSHGFLLPTAVRMVVPASGGGGASFGWENSVLLARPGGLGGCSRVKYPASCAALKVGGTTRSGFYTIELNSQGGGGEAPLEVYCDMSTDGGGWTIVFSTGCTLGTDTDTQNLCAVRSMTDPWPQAGLSRVQQRLLASSATETLFMRGGDAAWLKTSSANAGTDLENAPMVRVEPVNITAGSTGTMIPGFQAVARDGADFALYTNLFDEFGDTEGQCAAALLQKSTHQVFRAGAGVESWTALGCGTDQAPVAFYVALRGPASASSGCDANRCPGRVCSELQSSRHVCRDLSLDLAEESQVQFGPQELMFSADTWNIPQNVTATVANNAIQQADEQYRLSILHTIMEAASGDEAQSENQAATMISTIQVHVTEDDVAGLMIVSEVASTQESCTEMGSAASWQVSLTSAPVTDVVISVQSALGTSAVPALIFVPAAGAGDFCSDLSSDLGAVRARLATFSGMTNATVQQIDGSNEYLRQQAYTSTCPEWSDDHSSISDDTEAILVDANTVPPFSSMAGDVGVLFNALSNHMGLLPAQLQFVESDTETRRIQLMVKPCMAASSWNLPQRVTMTVEDDDLSQGDRQIAVVHRLVTEDPLYSALACESHTFVFAVADDDHAGIRVLGAPSTLKESGNADTLSIGLTSKPSADVIVSFETSWNLEVEHEEVTFTTTDYSSPKSTAVSAVRDWVNPHDNAGTGEITVHVRSADPAFDGLEVALSVGVEDDESVLASVLPTVVQMFEGGTACVALVLHTQPSAPVYAVLSTHFLTTQVVLANDMWTAHDVRQWTGSAEMTIGCSFGRILEVSGGDAFAEKQYDFEITDTTRTQLVVVAKLVAIGDWHNNRVVVTANGEQQASKTITVAPHASSTCGVQNTAAVTLTVQFVVPQPAHLVLRFETDLPDSAVASFGLAEVVLRADEQPVPGFCAPGTSDDTKMLAGVVTPESWRTPIDVQVVAIDDDIANDDRFEMAALTVCSEDERFNFNLPKIAVTVTNDETQRVFTDLQSVSIVEGGMASYLMWLGSQPDSDVRVQPTVPGIAVTAHPSEVVFNISSWNAPQRVTLSTGANLMASTQSANAWVMHTVSSSDGGYDGQDFMNLAVNVVDDDSAGITIGDGRRTLVPPIVLSLVEGSEQIFTLALKSMPSAAVEVRLSASAQFTQHQQDVVLLFTATSWEAPQTVTVSLAGNQAPGRQEGTVQLSVSSVDPAYALLVYPTIRFQIIDDDFARLGAELATVVEGGVEQNMCFTVDSSPSAPVALIAANAVLLTGCLDTLAVNYDERAAMHDGSLCEYYLKASGECGTVNLAASTRATQFALAGEYERPVVFVGYGETSTAAVMRDFDGCSGWCLHMRSTFAYNRTTLTNWMVLELGSFRSADWCAATLAHFVFD